MFKRTSRLIAAVIATSLMMALSFADSSQADSTFPCSIEGSYSIINGVVTNASSCIGKVTIDSSASSIGDRAFTNNIGITEVVVPTSVKSIGSTSFAFAANLSSITLTDSISSIPDNAFAQDWALTRIVLPDSITSIGAGAFEGDSHLSKILLPSNLNSIGSNAFAGMTLLSSITIPSGVTSILPNTFRGSGLKTLNLPNSISTFDSSAILDTLLDSYNYCGADLGLSIPAKCATPTPTPTPSPSLLDSLNSSVITPPTTIPSVSVRLEGKVLIAQVSSPLSLLTSPEGISGISEGLKMGFIQISTKDSSYKLSTNGANVQFTWDLSSLWDVILKSAKPLDIYSYFVNQVGNGQVNHVSFSLPVSSVAQVTKRPLTKLKSIVCYEGKTKKKVTGSAPVCPKGYKVKKL